MRACCVAVMGKGGAACTEPAAHKGHHHRLLHAWSEEGGVGQRKALATTTEDERPQRSTTACADARRLISHLTEKGHGRVGGHIFRAHLGIAPPGAERLNRHLQTVRGHGPPAHLRVVSPHPSVGGRDDEEPRVRVAGSTANGRQPALTVGDHDLDDL